MILLFSKENFDLTTDEIMDWLDFYNADFLRMNGEDLFSDKVSLTHEINNNKNTVSLIIEDKSIPLSEIDIIWYRRWISYGKLEERIKAMNLKTSLAIDLKNHITQELNTYSLTFFNFLKGIKWLDHPFLSVGASKKLEVLKFASTVGLKIPVTLVTNDVAKIKEFCTTYKRVITKPISEVQKFIVDQKIYVIRTEEVNIHNLKDLKNIQLSLFQELIEKQYEVRTFYLDGTFYSMAIFSQKDSQTEIDFRNYNFKKPNRCTPYILPKSIEDRLLKLFSILKLNHGSIDLIRDKKGEYIFLEINPVGQFGMISKACNYFLEEKVACYLRNQNAS